MEEEIKPKRIKDERFLLLSALNQVENIIKLTEENEYKQFIYMHLNPVYYELQRQLTNLKITDSITKEKQKEQ
tara:strand:- start:2437 stop:2655 length:219 start_codon:yes stop_codon:yes gene_type:complete